MSSINFLLNSPEEPTANRSETPSLTEFTLPEPAIPLPENPSDFTHVGQGYTVTTTTANPMAISRILNDNANNGSNEPVTIISPMRETIHNATTTSERPQYDRPNKRKLAATDDELNDEGPPSKKARSYANSEYDYDSDASSYCSTCWDVDSDIDSDTDSDIDTNTDFDSDTDAGSNTDLDLNADSDTDYDSDTDSDSDSDSDSDVDIDPPPMEVFLDNGIPMVIDNVTFLPRRRVPQDDFTGEQARHWYRERLRRDRERHEK